MSSRNRTVRGRRALVMTVVAALTLVVVPVVAEGKRPAQARGFDVVIISPDRHFDFRAVETPSGTKGQGGNEWRVPDGSRTRFSIDCIDVDGNQATMTGHITRSNKANPPVGMPVWFRVVKGEGADRDLMTYLIWESDSPDQWPADCHDETDPLYADQEFEVLSGWVKVWG